MWDQSDLICRSPLPPTLEKRSALAAPMETLLYSTTVMSADQTGSAGSSAYAGVDQRAMPTNTIAASKATLMARGLRARVDGPRRAATLKAEPVRLKRLVGFIASLPLVKGWFPVCVARAAHRSSSGHSPNFHLQGRLESSIRELDELDLNQVAIGPGQAVFVPVVKGRLPVCFRQEKTLTRVAVVEFECQFRVGSHGEQR